MDSATLFTLLYSSYFLSYISRKNIVFTAPYLLHHGFTRADLGASQSMFSVAYTLSKLYCNILCNWMSPRLVLSLGMISVGTINILAGLLNMPQYLWLLWGVNGLCCGSAWPPIAEIIVTHYNIDTRGRIWSLVSSSMNAGAMLSPILTDFLVKYGSWQLAFLVPGVLDILLGIVIYFFIDYKPKEKQSDTLNPDKKQENSKWNWDMIFNPFVLYICLGYIIATFSIIAMSTWGQMYFLEKLGLTALSAGTIISVYEIGGFCGATAVGFFADYLIKRAISRNPRAVAALMTSITACVASIALCKFPSSYFSNQIFAFGYGFGCFGTVATFGLMMREFAPQHGGTLSAVLAIASQLGGFSAGAPLGWYTEARSISDGFVVVMYCMPVLVTCMCLLTTLSNRYKVKHN